SEKWNRLDESFQNFYTKIRLTDYISKAIWRYAKDFHAKRNRNRLHYLLILDQPLQVKEGKSETTYKDQLIAKNNKSEEQKIQTLLEEIENHELYYHLKTLTNRQLKILDLYYLHGLTQK